MRILWNDSPARSTVIITDVFPGKRIADFKKHIRNCWRCSRINFSSYTIKFTHKSWHYRRTLPHILWKPVRKYLEIYQSKNSLHSRQSKIRSNIQGETSYIEWLHLQLLISAILLTFHWCKSKNLYRNDLHFNVELILCHKYENLSNELFRDNSKPPIFVLTQTI